MAKLIKYLAILLPALEIVVLLLVGEEIGVANTMLALLAGVVLGMAVIKFLGGAALREFQDAVRRGAPPLDALRDGAVTLGAGVLLIIPGFITDAIAILLLLRAGWGRLRRPRVQDQPLPGAPPSAGMPTSGMPGVAKIVEADYVIIEKDGPSDARSTKREAP
jgi:UPF0716 protein FxsA